MNIDPTAGIGGAYVIDPQTGERVPETDLLPLAPAAAASGDETPDED